MIAFGAMTPSDRRRRATSLRPTIRDAESTTALTMAAVLAAASLSSRGLQRGAVDGRLPAGTGTPNGPRRTNPGSVLVTFALSARSLLVKQTIPRWRPKA